MNDFTEEELLAMFNIIKYDAKLGNEIIEYLSNKIQSMIDNYCEHDFVTFLQDQNNEPFIAKCMRCHFIRVSNDNQ